MVFSGAQSVLGMAYRVPSAVPAWPGAQLPGQLLWADRAEVRADPQSSKSQRRSCQAWQGGWRSPMPSTCAPGPGLG